MDSVEPRRCAVYRLYDAADRLLYIGMSVDPAARLNGHRFGLLSRQWASLVTRMDTTWYDTEEEAAIAEGDAIRKESPPHNGRGGLPAGKAPKPRRPGRSNERPKYFDFGSGREAANLWRASIEEWERRQNGGDKGRPGGAA